MMLAMFFLCISLGIFLFNFLTNSTYPFSTISDLCTFIFGTLFAGMAILTLGTLGWLV